MALVAWYKLNGNVLDSTVNGNHGTIVGSPTVVSDGPFGSCYLFNPDTNDRITINNLSSFIYNTPFTFSAWIKTSGLGTGQTVNGIITLTYGTRFFCNSAGNLYINFLSTNIGSYSITSSGVNLYDNVWHHVCCTYDGDILKLYIDGNLNVTGVTEIVQTNTYTNNGAIGLDVNDSSKCKFNGSISDVRIYDEALSLKEIKELSKAKVLHYDFNQFQEPTTNLVLNPEGKLINELYVIPGTYTPGWDSSLHSDAIVVYNWSTGYNSGVTSPSIGYHGRWIYEGINGNSDPCMFFQDENDQYDLGHRWLGIAQSLNTPQYLGWSVGTVLTLSWYQKANVIKGGQVGIYHKLISTGASSFSGSLQYFPVSSLNSWERVSYNITIDSDWDLTKSMTLYVYGHVGDYGKLWVDNIQLEQKNHLTPFISGFRDAKIYDKSGWNNNGIITEATAPTYVNESIVNNGCYEFDGTQNIEITKKLYDNGTISLWYYPDSFYNYNTIFDNSSNADYWECWIYSDGILRFRLYNTTYVSYNLNNLNGPQNWYNIIITWKKTDNIILYINGEQRSVANVSTNWVDPGDSLYLCGGLNTKGKGKIADFRIYSTALSEDDIKEIYQTRASIDENGNLYCNNTEENKYVAPLIDYTSWVIGTSGAQTGFALNGTTTENYIIEGSDPFNNIIPIWEARPEGISGADGGWATSSFNIDNTKLYRFSVWVRRTVIGNGSFYLGVNGYGSVNGVYTLANVNNTNPYFYSSSGLFTNRQDQWLLVVGYVYPYTYTGTTSPADAGIYNVDGTKIVASTTSFKWRPETTTARHRSYLYYSTNIDTRQQWCYPRVDICDGTEPTITDLLNGIDYKHYQIAKDLIASKGINKNSSILSNEFSEVGITEGLVAYYPLNGDAKDYSGNNNHGTIYGAIKASGIAGKKCYSFDGTDDYIEILSNEKNILSNISFSISLWLYPINENGYFIINKGKQGWSSHGSSNIKLYSIEGSDASGYYKIYFHLIDGVTHYVNDWYSTNNGLVYNTWNNIVAVCNRELNLLYLYNNGKLLSTGNITGLGDISSDYPLRFATEYRSGLTPVNWLNGNLQDVRIYNRALSDKEINILYNMYDPNINKTLQINKENIIYTKGNIKEV